jgi:hypothetical protein
VLALLALQAFAADHPVRASLHGDIKTFFVADVPGQWFGFSDDAAPTLDAMGLTEAEALDQFGLAPHPAAQGVAGLRLKLAVTRGDRLRLDVHWALAAENAVGSSLVPGAKTGIALSAPEVVRLTWHPDLGENLALQHRFDRLMVSAKVGRVDLTFGRQPISFGSGLVFNPLDLVNPFGPATIDSEYKPGVDAVRVDAYVGATGKVTVAGAYAGAKPLVGPDRRAEGPILDDLVLAATGQGTVGVTDLTGFAGVVHGDPVVGVSVVSAVGAVGLHGDATLTVPGDGVNPFVRAVAGADFRPTTTTTLLGEAYVQSSGATSPDRYLDALDDPRFLRGEIWQLGQLYAAVTVAQEITPIIGGNLSVIANLRDPSALVALGGSWSVDENATVALGAYLGAGQHPDTVDFGLAGDASAPVLVPPSADALAESVNSEFGLYPAVVYLQVRTYF